MDYKTYLKYTAKLSLQSTLVSGVVFGGMYLYALYK